MFPVVHYSSGNVSRQYIRRPPSPRDVLFVPGRLRFEGILPGTAHNEKEVGDMENRDAAVQGDDAVTKPFLKILKDCFKENLGSVILYGSYVSGSFVKGVSDVNVLIILEESDPGQLIDFGRAAGRFMKRRRITPLVLTKKEFINSADVFPMEYFDIKDNKRVVFGPDETEALSLTRKNLRHQVEDRLRGELASLRQLVIASRGKKRVLRRYLKLWAGSVNAVFRAVLRLKEKAGVPFSSEVLAGIREAFGVDTTPFSELNSLRGGSKLDPSSISSRVLESLLELIRVVDTITL
jgi:predicted nucleotidyltransferase